VRFLRVCVVLAAALLMCGVAQAQVVSDATGFTAGPRVVAGGLLWSSPSGVFMSSSSGAATEIAPGVQLSAISGDQDWFAVSTRSGVRAARFGGRPVSVRLWHRCRPAQWSAGSQPPMPLVAVTGRDLYTIINAHCLDESRRTGQLLVGVQLRAGTAHVLARIPADAATVTATGSRVALTYLTGYPARAAHVDVLNATTGRQLFTVRFPTLEPSSPQISTQLDSLGDVLLTDTVPLPPGTVASGWWGNQHNRVAHPVDGLVVGANPQPPPTGGDYVAPAVAVSLSNGLLAYATYPHGSPPETIAVRDLATNTTRTVASFPGSASVLGIGLQGTRLAWAQQSLGYTTPTAAEPCVTQAQALGPVQLVTTNVNISKPISEPGEPVPPRTGPLCPPPP
jgi:hypothetical protein